MSSSRLASLLALVPILLIGGCQGSRRADATGVSSAQYDEWRRDGSIPPAVVLALPGDTIASLEAAPQSPLLHERFEFARSDYSVSPSPSVPILATNQWPEPLPPRERRVQFHRWRQ